jgi:transcription termination factor Rho
VTETDLITADGSNENVELPQTVTSNISTPAEADDASNGASTAETAPTADVASGDRRASLSTMVLPELRALAKEVGVEGASGMRKSELVAAIRERRGESNGRPHAATGSDANDTATPDTATPAADTATDAGTTEQAAEEQTPPRRERRGASRGASAPGGSDENTPEPDQQKPNKQKKADTDADRPAKQDTRSDGGDQQGDQGGQNRGQNRGDDDDDGRGGRRGRRFRDRRRRERGGEGGGGGDRDTELREDDVVQPVAGILDVLDNYAFVRTSGYLAGPNDVYVSMNMVRKNGLRRGDAITGAVRVPKDGEQPNQRQKFNPLVRLDTVNGGPVEDAKNRPDFNKLTPLYPNQRLRLETTPDRLTTRVIDLIMPIGKGQRALIVSPPKAGKTTILQDIANGVAQNNPECHLMVVLVDERPEEVTDMQRSVKGEVIASTFDRPPSDHTQAAELAIERAKRLVEQGRDVIVLLDSITRLGRAYNNASPASGRILSGGVDSTALYPPKRFLGAARNIEFGGSLTIIATAMVETGSTGDTVIFEEFKGTGNAELKLDRKISERRVFPAVDVNPSGTRKDELLLSTDEFAVVHKLRRVLSGLDPHQAIDLLMSQLRKTKTNYEFLVQVSKTTPGSMDSD